MRSAPTLPTSSGVPARPAGDSSSIRRYPSPRGPVSSSRPALKPTEAWANTRDGDVVSVYPVDNDGHEQVWRYSRPTMQA
jgi:hypothetical protein